MADYLKHYIEQDVRVMVPLIAEMQSQFRQVNSKVTPIRDCISLPNFARIVGYEMAEKEGASFHLCKGDDEGHNLERKIRQNLAGGPSIILNREVVGGETFVPGQDGELIDRIVTYDANAIYSRCMQYDMPNDSCVHIYEAKKERDNERNEKELDGEEDACDSNSKQNELIVRQWETENNAYELQGSKHPISRSEVVIKSFRNTFDGKPLCVFNGCILMD